ncbi:expressed unknown protein [Seminavis robusta]|uniref:Uncharacterized protein n=1 Tax=Seminavis robusta TaxID=568900 RepID=A0A9N8DDS3_9STRA|nr:expressed unknown protein [Seminavis robusta]|eukprot:Sro47_g027770.1 n/a (643) ;mRNA; f:57060-58988
MNLAPMNAKCVLDPLLVNASTLANLDDVGVSIFAPACSKNRGAFILDPPDGKTYGCLALPHFDLDLNSSSSNTSAISLTKVEDITKNFANGNLTAEDAVEVLDFLVARSYASTPGVDVSPYACDISGLATLQDCPFEPYEKGEPIRAVTVAGVFSPAYWSVDNSSTPIGFSLTHRDAEFFYVKKDFAKMAKMGINTVQFPVAVELFDVLPKPHVNWLNLLRKWMRFAFEHDLQSIVKLEYVHGRTEDAARQRDLTEALIFFNGINVNKNETIVRAVTLPSVKPSDIEAAKVAATKIPLWIPATPQELTHIQEIVQSVPDAPIAAVSLDLSHTSTIAEIASSNPTEDRSKLVFHETMACLKRAPLEYTQCYQGLPVFVASGFDLAIDDCHLRRLDKALFRDYGQCGRLEDTLYSKWWSRHRLSFAARQMAAYERGGLGWSFATWKVFRVGNQQVGVIDKPAKLLSLRDVAAMGWIPSLFEDNNDACLNPPENDFLLGDETLAPTMGPPPDCGDGWWNATTDQCDFWVPPPFNATECPNTTIIYKECPSAETEAESNEEALEDEHDWLAGLEVGILGTCILAGVVIGLCARRHFGYETIGKNPYHNNGFQEYQHHANEYGALDSHNAAGQKPLNAPKAPLKDQD